MSRTLDLSRATHERLIRIAFDHPVSGDGARSWYWGESLADVFLAGDPRGAVRFLTRLFDDPGPLMERFSAAQMDQGMWFLLSNAPTEWFHDALWNAEVPWAERAACIAALPALYARLFEPLMKREPDFDLSSAFMLPDWLAFPYDLGQRSRDSGEERRVQDALFGAFATMLESADWDTQRAAIHGIFHLRHPGGDALVRRYLDGSRHLPDWLRRYAEGGFADVPWL